MAHFLLWGVGMYGHHDSYAQYVFERPENAETLLFFALPPDIVDRVDWTTLRLERSTFTHPALRAALGDLLFSVCLKDTGQTIFFLLEHQSEQAWDMAERLQKYEARQRGTLRRRRPKARQMPMMLGVVLYHGAEPWTAPRQLQGLLGLTTYPAYLLVELRLYTEEQLLALPATPLARLALLLLRFGRTPLLRDKLLQWVPLFQEVYATPSGAEDLETTVSYVRELGDYRTDAVLQQVLSCLMTGRKAEELMQTVGQKLREEGRLLGRVEGKIEGKLEGKIEGKIEGRAEGRAEGLAEAVLKLLAARGIPVDGAAHQLIVSCTDLGLLDLWFGRALHATSLSDVLRQPAQ